jgi:PBSX family phage terminase large subunit
MLEDATIQTFKEVCGAFFRPEDFKKSDNHCVLQNGTEILFRSTDDPDKLRGPNLSMFWLDEAAMMPEMVWDLMIGRLRLEPGRGIITTTPRGKNWLWKLFLQKNLENPNYHLTQCSSKSNIFLPDYFIEALESQYTGHWLKQELEGEFVEFIEAQAYEDFKSPVNVCDADVEPDDIYDPRLPLYLACDFNNHVMAWPVIQIARSGKPRSHTWCGDSAASSQRTQPASGCTGTPRAPLVARGVQRYGRSWKPSSVGTARTLNSIFRARTRR